MSFFTDHGTSLHEVSEGVADRREYDTKQRWAQESAPWVGAPDPAGEGGPVVQNNQFRANNCTDTWLRWCADKHVAEIRNTVAARGHTTIVRWPDARYRAAVIEALQDAGYNVKVYPAFTGVDDK